MSGWLMGIIALIVGGLGGYVARNYLNAGKISNAEADAEKILAKAKAHLAEAEQRGKEVVLEAKEEASKIREKSEREEKERRSELLDLEKRFIAKDEQLS